MTEPTPSTERSTSPSRRLPAKRLPALRWIRRAPAATFALAIVLVVVLTVAALALANPGHRVGPVRPANPPVGQGDTLPVGP